MIGHAGWDEHKCYLCGRIYACRPPSAGILPPQWRLSDLHKICVNNRILYIQHSCVTLSARKHRFTEDLLDA